MSSFSPMNQAQESPEIQMTGVRMNLKSSFDSLIENKLDTVKVYCRIRPMLQNEEDAGYTECIAAIDDQVVRAVVPTSSVKYKNSSHNGQEIIQDFKYTLAFGPEVGQFSFFHETILDIMQAFIEGQNGLIFSYGITNSGKTYTLQGDEANPGIIPLALHLFFASTEHQLLHEVSVKPDKYSDIVVLNHNERSSEQQLKQQLIQLSEHESGNKSTDSTKSFGMTLCDAFYDKFKFEDRQTTLPPEEMIAAQSALYMKDIGKKSADEQAGLCSVWVSFIEIYNEYIYDLLQPNILQRQKLNLAEDQNGDVYVKGAREICVSSSEEAIKLLNLGRRNLRIASTKLNYQSSRSHCIYTLKVIRLYDEENSSCGRVNRISFCDLAGSERAAKSQTSGLRLKEAGYINSSLLVLGRCLEQLRLNQTAREKKMIPYRESKLTRLFYSHFLGKGKATMIANASPCELTFDETLNVLRFSALTTELTLNDSYISMASNSIQNLTTQWGQTRVRSIAEASHDQSSDFDTSLSCEIQEKDEIIEKLLDLAHNLRDNLNKEKKEKTELEIVIRQDVCTEYSAFSDKLIENQRKISEQRIEGVKRNFQKRFDNMEKMYQDKIKELTAQLEEYEECSEESINESGDKGNETSMSKIAQVTKSIPSPQINLFDEKIHDDDSQDVIEFEKLECTFAEHEKLISENKSLKLDLSSLKNELESTTEQLQKYTVMIVDLQNEIKQYEENSMDVKDIKVEQIEAETSDEVKSLTEELQIAKEQLKQSSVLLEQSQTKETIALESCDDLKRRLVKVTNVSEEYKKKFDEIKLNSIDIEREQLALLKEKQDLEENISSLSEKLALAISDAEQLKQTKLQAEEKYSQQSIEILQIKTEYELKCEQLSLKWEETKKALEERKSKILDLESECNNYKNDNIKLVEDNKTLEEQFALISEQMGKAIPEEQYNELCSKNNELTLAFEEQQLKLETATEALKEQELKLSKLESKCATSKVNYDKLLEEHLSVVESFDNLKEEMENTVPTGKYEELVCNVAELSRALKEQELGLEIATEALKEQKSKFKKLEEEYIVSKNENAKLLEDYNCMKEKLNLSIKELEKTDVKQLNTELKTKLEDATQSIVSRDLKIDELEAECSELNSQLKKSSETLNEQKAAFDALTAKCASHESKIISLSENYSILEEDFNKTKTELDAANIELQTRLEESTQIVERQEMKIDELENKCNDLCTKVEITTDSLRDQKSKFEELSIEATACQEDKIKLMEKYTALEIEFRTAKDELEREVEEKDVKHQSNLEKSAEEHKMTDLISQLEKSTQLIEKEKCKVLELQLACTKYKNDHEELLKFHENFCEEVAATKQELHAMKIQNENLTKGKSAVENALQESLAKIEENIAGDVTDELKTRLQESTQIVESQKLKINELDNKCKDFRSKLEIATHSLEDEKSKFEELALKTSMYEEDMNELKTRLQESTDTVESQKKKINELDNKCKDFCSKLEIDTHSLADEKSKFEELVLKTSMYEEDMNELKTKLQESTDTVESQKIKINELDNKCKDFCNKLEIATHALADEKSKFEELTLKTSTYEEDNSKLMQEYSILEKEFNKVKTESDALNAEYEQLKKDHISLENSHATSISELQTIIECAKMEVKELEETLQACKDENIELQKDLKNIENKLESQAEKEGHLLNVLGKCELTATNKMEFLRSSSMKNLEENLDLKRQVKEKETSIEQLEKAVRDSQEVKKENEDKLEKQITALKHQHSIEIEEIMHLKRISEQEIIKLKSVLAQVENQKEETLDQEENKENSLKSKTNKGNKKESSSKEENEISEENEVPKQRRTCRRKEDKTSEDSSIVPKRRRPLRSKQAKISEDIEEEKNEENSDDDQKSTKGANKRKSAEQEWKPPTKKRTTKKKLVENSENMSPVQKAISYVGAKFRSVAQSVSTVPSPRVTRGRKKLFNVDTAAASSSGVPKWKL